MRRALITVSILIATGLGVVGVELKASAQPADDGGPHERLEFLADLWGKIWLFHPALVSSDIDWDQALLDSIPLIEDANTTDELIRILNESLLSRLDDPTVFAQRTVESSARERPPLSGRILQPGVGYLDARNPDQQARRGFADRVRSAVQGLGELQLLVIDLRLGFRPEELGERAYGLVSASWLGLFAEQPLAVGQYARRRHVGWNQFNSPRSIYRQGWEVGGAWTERGYSGKPLLQLGGEPITTPTVFLINNSAFPFFEGTLDALQATGRVFVAWEKTGRFMDVERVEGQSILEYGDLQVWLMNAALISRGGGLRLRPEYSTSQTIEEREIAPLAQRVVQSGRAQTAPFQPVVHVGQREPFSTAPLTREQRLLGLFRIWTVLSYFDPHLSLADLEWGTMLRDWIPRVEAAESIDDYYADVLPQLGAKLNDSHVAIHPAQDRAWFVVRHGGYRPPVRLEHVEGKVIVAEVFDSYGGSDVQVGDEVVAIDDRPIVEVEAYWRARTSASTEGAFNRSWYLTVAGPRGSMSLTVRRSGPPTRLSLPRELTAPQWARQRSRPPAYEEFAEGVGYMNFGRLLRSEDRDRALEALRASDGLILDLRQPTTNTRNWLLQNFADKPVRMPVAMVPVASSWDRDALTFATRPSRERGSDSRQPFTRPVVILIGPSVQSNGESACMAMQQLDHVTLVGERTAGTTGDTADVYLPGGGWLHFTGTRIQYPDGSRFQNVGVVPDDEVHPTIDGIRAGRDEVLERGLEILHRKISASRVIAWRPGPGSFR